MAGRPPLAGGAAAAAVRNHGQIENGLHWVLDVVFAEDLSRLRKGRAMAPATWRSCATSPSTSCAPRPSRKVEPTADGEKSWSLAELRDRLEEIVRAAEAGNAQRVIVDGRESVVVISTDELQRLLGSRTGQALIDAMQACPYPDFERPVFSPVRDVEL